MSTLMYTLEVPTRFLIVEIILSIPRLSISRAVMVEKPHFLSFFMSPFLRIRGARIPTWIDVLRIRP